MNKKKHKEMKQKLRITNKKSIYYYHNLLYGTTIGHCHFITSLRVQSKPQTGLLGCSGFGLNTTPEIRNQFLTTDTSPNGTLTHH
jgi:hypothetical protein